MINYYLEKHSTLHTLIELHACMIGFTRYEQYCNNKGVKHYSKATLDSYIRTIREQFNLYQSY